jgi:outer membrane protein TolC
MADMYGNNSSAYSPVIYQYQGTQQSYWNVGVNLAVPVEDILDLGAAVKRKRLEVDQAIYNKDYQYDQLKLQIASLYTKITTGLIVLKTASENAAIYQGAGALNEEEFHNGNMTIEDFAFTKAREDAAVTSYQNQQASLITDILTLEIITHTPILTNSTTEITLDKAVQKSEKQLAKENKAVEKRVKKAAEEEEKKLKALEKAEAKAQKTAKKAAKK